MGRKVAILECGQATLTVLCDRLDAIICGATDCFVDDGEKEVCCVSSSVHRDATVTVTHSLNPDKLIYKRKHLFHSVL